MKGDGGVVRMVAMGGEKGEEKVVAVGDKGKVEVFEFKEFRKGS